MEGELEKVREVGGGGGRESREERHARRDTTGGRKEVRRDGETHKWSLTEVIKV